MAIDDDGYEGRFDDDGFGDGLDADDADDVAPAKKKKRVATSTKVVLVVAGWLLLTLFLVGEFSKDKPPTDTVSAQLDTIEGDAEFDDAGTPDIVDTEAEEVFDADGDGLLSESERTTAVEAYEAAVASGEVAVGEVWNGVYEGSASTTEEGTADAAVPGTGPTSGGSTSGGSTGPGTETGTGSASGTSTTTTIASAAGGGGGGGSTTTTKPSSGGAATTAKPTTTTAPPPTTATPTTTAGGGGVDVQVFADDALGYTYPEGIQRDFSVPQGSKIVFDNRDNIRHSFTIDGGWDSGEIRNNEGLRTSPALEPGTFTYKCVNHPTTMNGSLTVS